MLLLWWAPCRKDLGFVWSVRARDGAADGSSRVLGQKIGFFEGSSEMPPGFNHQARHGQGSADLLTARARAGACLVASPRQLLCTINYGRGSAGFPSSVAPVRHVGRSWDAN